MPQTFEATKKLDLKLTLWTIFSNFEHYSIHGERRISKSLLKERKIGPIFLKALNCLERLHGPIHLFQTKIIKQNPTHIAAGT